MGSADYIDRDALSHVYALLMPANRLVLEVCEQTGLRVGDVLGLRTQDMRQRMTVHTQKTGKGQRVYFTNALWARMMAQAGSEWVFEGRRGNNHRSYEAVYKDLRRAADALRVPNIVHKRQQVSPHSMRKRKAVDVYTRTGEIAAAGRALGHNEKGLEVTMLYALSDVITARKLGSTKTGRKKTNNG